MTGATAAGAASADMTGAAAAGAASGDVAAGTRSGGGSGDSTRSVAVAGAGSASCMDLQLNHPSPPCDPDCTQSPRATSRVASRASGCLATPSPSEPASLLQSVWPMAEGQAFPRAALGGGPLGQSSPVDRL